MRAATYFAAVFLVGAAVFGASDPSTGSPVSIVDSNNQFALDAYSRFRVEPGNVFFSPYSISTALAMAYEGARGRTADEMRRVFHFPLDREEHRRSAASLHTRLNEPNAKHTLAVANALWVQRDCRLSADYVRTVQTYYGGQASRVDFVGATDETRKTINQWVESKTNNKIKNLFPEGSLDQRSRLVLTNAIYFKGQWVNPFDPAQTTPDDFHVARRKTVRVPMMQLAGARTAFPYADAGDLQILEMPYEGEKLSMLVLLPVEHDLESLERSLSLRKINEWKRLLMEQPVDVYMPRFKVDTKYTMNETLREMGMPTAFSERHADFSGMAADCEGDDSTKLAIKTVIHQAFVDVNEKGTEAAAATGVGMITTDSIAPPTPVFRADHPFIFLIQDKTNGNILFLGRMTDPS